MCGHVGIAGDIEVEHNQLFYDMLCFDTRRGPHSTGVLRVDKSTS